MEILFKPKVPISQKEKAREWAIIEKELIGTVDTRITIRKPRVSLHVYFDGKQDYFALVKVFGVYRLLGVVITHMEDFTEEDKFAAITAEAKEICSMLKVVGIVREPDWVLTESSIGVEFCGINMLTVEVDESLGAGYVLKFNQEFSTITRDYLGKIVKRRFDSIIHEWRENECT